MKATEFRKLIREEVRKILTEAKSENYPFMQTLEQEKLYRFDEYLKFDYTKYFQ